MKFFSRFLFLLSLQLLGLFLFARGFFLMRIELGVNSTCNDNLPLLPSFTSPLLIKSSLLQHQKAVSSNSKSCWTVPTFDRLVFVVIDALRYDFADPRYILESSLPHNMNFQGRMPHLAYRLNNSRKRSRLYRFEADAPTVTMQRLKALTSGCLPTFVDVSANFASSIISEDNFISQAHILGKKIIFMGDDTWLSLFPSQLSSTRFSFPFPSFNVQDLHTVDNGVLQHLFPLFRKDDDVSNTTIDTTDTKDTTENINWDILIAHFLGVDHVGHRYGPNHYEMYNKLNQMDNVLQQLSQELEEESNKNGKKTLLVVLGDHGMTAGGNHGGATEEEIGAALYVESFGKDLFDPSDGYDPHMTKKSMEQIDIVPTLSLALGLPIPYSSLGLLATDWNWADNSSFSSSSSSSSSAFISTIQNSIALTNGLYLNAHQIKRFLLAYASVASSLSTGIGKIEFEIILQKFNTAISLVNEAYKTLTVYTDKNEEVNITYGSSDRIDTSHDYLRGRNKTTSSIEKEEKEEMEFINDVENGYTNLLLLLAQKKNDLTINDKSSLLQLNSSHRIAQEALQDFVRSAAILCRRLWTQFDLVSMCVGIFILFIATILTIYYGLGLDMSSMSSISSISSIDDEFQEKIKQNNNDTSIVDPTLSNTFDPTLSNTRRRRRLSTQLIDLSSSSSSSSSTSPSNDLVIKTKTKVFSIPSFIALLVLILRLWALFTDTFIEAEESVIEVLYAIVALACAFHVSQYKNIRYDLIIIASFSIICGRFAAYFGGKGLSVEASTVNQVSLISTLFPLSILGLFPLSLMSSIYDIYNNLQYCLILLCHILSSVIAYLYWQSQANGTLTHSYRLLLPRIVYILGLVSFTLNKVLSKFQTKKLESKIPPLVSSIYSTLYQSRTIWLMSLSFLPSLSLLLGPWSPTTLLFLSGQAITASLLISNLSSLSSLHESSSSISFSSTIKIFIESKVKRQGDVFSILLNTIHILISETVLFPVLLIYLLSVFSFHVTGHAPKFSSLAFSAPFVGVEAVNGKVNFLLAGIMVLFNTVGASHGIVLLLVMTSLSNEKDIIDIVSKERFLLQVICPFLFASLCCCIFCLYARRELMVWAIFAPKFLFDAGSLILIDIILLLFV